MRPRKACKGSLGEEMSELNKKHLLRLAALVFAAAILLPLVFGSSRIIEGQTGGDGWRNFIFDFQTLLTGILAIAAAWWNITVMRAVDRESDRRHKETLEKGKIEETRIIERAVNPQIAHINAGLEIIRMQKRQMLSINTLEGQLDRLATLAPVLAFFIRNLEDALSRQQIQEGMRFFDGELTYQISALRRRVTEAVKAVEVIEKRGLGRTPLVENADFAVSDLYRFFTRGEEDIVAVLEGLKSKAARYNVDIVGLDHK